MLAQWMEKAKVAHEAHSTNYQTQTACRELAHDHFATLKVGSALTFALHEAILTLAQIEQELIAPENRSRCLTVIEEMMPDEPQHWEKYYRTGFSDSLLGIRYSPSNRIRYYRSRSRIKNGVEAMTVNLEGVDISLGMTNQYLSKQLEHTRSKELSAILHQLIMDKTYGVLHAYRYGCAEQGRYMTNLLARSGTSFVDRNEVLIRIGNEMFAKGAVHDTRPQALITGETEFLTGIMLQQYAIAIPHCEVTHAKSSAIYSSRPTSKVHFQQADDNNDVAISSTVALIVEDPQQQLKLSRCLLDGL